jgi:hypothetical protein
MQRILCGAGLSLNAAYLRANLDWISTEANKRVAVAMEKDIPSERWMTMARCAEEMKATHDAALEKYLDHVAACALCSKHLID